MELVGSFYDFKNICDDDDDDDDDVT